MKTENDLSKLTRTEAAVGFPQVILIDNSSACNLRCSMCDHRNIQKHRKIQVMDMKLYSKIIDEIALKQPDTRVWQIYFGDPFTCKNIAERIAQAKHKGLTDVVLNSNGALMTPDRAGDVIKAGLDTMYVGIDAAREATYRKIRVGGDFGSTVQNVLSYRDLLLAHGRPGQQLFVQFVVTDTNEDQVEEFTSFWLNEGVQVKIRPKISWAGLVTAENLRDNQGMARKPCYWSMQTMSICADGRVSLCAVDIHCRVENGDINEVSIETAWNQALKLYRTMHAEHRFDELPQMCRDCRDWQSAYADYVQK